MSELFLQDPRSSPSDPAAAFATIATALVDSGWGVFSGLMPDPLVHRLADTAQSLETYREAGVGRHTDNQRNPFVRRDRIVWIDAGEPAARDWLRWSEGLRVHLNRTLMLGLSSFESHFACYEPGAFYRKHVDAFRGEANRVVSVICYRNTAWLPGDGGELVLYDEYGRELGRFPPALGTLAVFLSERFPHEVLPARAPRYSLAGWFRCRAELPLANL